MQIARYIHKKQKSYGIINQQTIISIPKLAKKLNTKLPKTLNAYIQNQTAQKTTENHLVTANETTLKEATIPLNQTKLLAPIQHPPKIICLGWNYIDHAKETKTTPSQEPIIFIKPHTTIIGPNQKIIKPTWIKQLDYEAELAIVIGKKAKNIAAADAKKYIFGYTILNDISARDLQFKDQQWTRAKSFDTFAPTGPAITTQNQLPNTSNLSIRTWVNNEMRQNGSTKDMLFDINQIIYHLSRVMTLEPRDIIATGTPSGVGMAMKPQQWLKDGDLVRIEIEGIGKLENQIEEQQSNDATNP